ncbi:MAG: GAF domain-containing protein, partial [Pseudomonadota bacterium]
MSAEDVPTELDAALSEAQARESALREILQVISRSRADEKPVIDAVLENAARLCGAPAAALEILDPLTGQMRFVATWGDEMKSFKTGDTYDPDPNLIVVRSINERKPVQVEDAADDDLYRQGQPTRVQMVDEEGIRTLLAVPLVSADKAMGAIGLYRKEARAFTAEEIALVEAFAEQAIIAIDNVRQFKELATRFEREGATREILEVISQSRANEAPVFDAILENASRLCNAPLAYLCMTTEDRTHVISPARRGTFEKFGETLDNLQVPLAESKLALARAINECRVFREDDIADHELYSSGDPDRVSMVENEGARSLMVVPLLNKGTGVGSITLYRRKVDPFRDDDVTLVESFAAQAVIAIENVRQFRELQTRLEREAATREVLQAISQSRDDEQPVFEVILENAARLCNAPHAGLLLVNDDESLLQLVASNSATSRFIEQLKENPHSLTKEDSLAARAIRTRQIGHYPDIADDPEGSVSP